LALAIVLAGPQLPAVAKPAMFPSVIVADTGHRIGTVGHFGPLTVAPILAGSTLDVGPFASLDHALKAGGAIVQEVGTDRPAVTSAIPGAQHPVAPNPPAVPVHRPHENAPNIQQNRMPEMQVQVGTGTTSALVNTLEIVNKGKTPILVLAGTIVKGGRQDRQIGQDFIIEPGKKASVDAYCVEHGRWNASRSGKDTAGKFETAQILANQSVRVAGQYEQNQSKVWAKVAETNQAAGAQSTSDTLSATLDDAVITQQRMAIADRITVFLNGIKDKQRLIGIAYGLDGRPRSVRWFASPALFGFFQETLVNTTAFDAVTAALQKTTPSAPAPVLTSAGFASWVSGIRSTPPVERRQTEAGNVNVVWRTDAGYGSETLRMVKGKPVAVTADFLAK
jgi:hypothetical protein